VKPPPLRSLTAVLAALSVVLAGGAGGGKAEQTAGTSAIAFDRAFIDAMVPHHRSGIEIAKTAKTAGLSGAELVEI